MADRQALALKYRPRVFDDVTEQGSVRKILEQQLKTNTFKSAYLFCGAAGTGKTTCARIFANEINKGVGNPIEMDAASHNSVEDVRRINDQARTKSLEGEYKIFIIDECHSLSNSAWQAMLKLIEEPPLKTIFIFATTDPQKIPRTILSRVQRYDFQRITTQGIINRLTHIIETESISSVDTEAIEFIAKMAEGGMRDALTLLDKCLSYNNELTVNNVIKALGTVNYDIMFELTDSIIFGQPDRIMKITEDLYLSGIDLKQFIKTYLSFILDVNKYCLIKNFDYITIPIIYENTLRDYLQINDGEFVYNLGKLLETLIKLNANIKWETSPKSLIQATLLLEGK